MSDTNMTQTHFRCHDADACKFGQAPCPTPDCCGCPVTHEGYTPAGAEMQIDEPKKSAVEPSLQALHALILDGDLTAAERMCDQLIASKQARYTVIVDKAQLSQIVHDVCRRPLPELFAWALCGAAVAVICMKVFA